MPYHILSFKQLDEKYTTKCMSKTVCLVPLQVHLYSRMRQPLFEERHVLVLIVHFGDLDLPLDLGRLSVYETI